ncbi:NAD(P)-dependent alcohol dehydrogenase [Salinibacterium sp. SWN1162]|uniref:NAD(P)-dependent alcohol dehydrogenase n=1 Tax=Salinibacterium sp. SWN1162 TaxID=2792053 RepID=UPI0018CCC81D|nr:NAD(P)-dependent alcohol dehydrogenase [Salinibacterium sp. SWN1162]MBH0008419.1 NAD(P)-dependent alcohol dehydrogenase [Salinibacterium sp. SWN1162]
MSIPPHTNPSPDGTEPEAPAGISGATPVTIPETMTAVTGRHYGDTDVLAIETLPTPLAAPGKLLVKVLGSSANALDWRLLSGTPLFVRLVMGLRKPKRLIPGADVAGRVVAVGDGVTGFAIGDAVFGEAAGGAFAEYATVTAKNFVTVPAGIDFVAAGATPVAGLTALQGLRSKGAVKPGDRVLINGAAGGVGTFAVQLARILGATEITAVCSGRNAEQSLALGATHVIDYESEDYIEVGGQYDVIFDLMGNRTADDMRTILAPGARFVGVSGPMTNRWVGPVFHLMRMGRAFKGSDVTFHQFTAGPTPDDLAYLAQLLAAGELVPAIERVVGLDGVVDAIDQIASSHSQGKVAIVPGGIVGEGAGTVS